MPTTGWGIVFWGVLAAVDYGRTRGRRDFTAMSTTLPPSYEVMVESAVAARARTTLATA